MPDTHAVYTFLPFVRQGIARAIPGNDTLGAPGVAPPPNSVTLPVALRVNDRDEIKVNARPYGPGDVTGIDPRVVIRTEPRHLATDFEPNYFPAVDFDPPDFPWLFTPVGAGDQDRLRPWVCLVVVPRAKAMIAASPTGALPALSCPRAELPDLIESWAWAHAQLTGVAADADLNTSLAGSPELTLSRLISPRKLEPNTRYYACVVPAFEPGAQAGLGQPVTGNDLLPAWLSTREAGPDAETLVTVPVYYQWEFSTGAAGDFESFVRLLKPGSLPEDVGLRELDIRAPGLGLPRAGDEVGLEGALRTPRTRPTAWPDEQGRRFQDALKALLNKAEATLETGAPAGFGETAESEPVVAPPVYGRWHAASPLLNGGSPLWLGQLNLDPRHRAAAGFGTLVVQDQQEQLMASAWEQLGEIQRANQLFRQSQLARAVGLAIHEKRLAKLRPDLLVQVTGSVHSRVRLDGHTLAYRVRRSALPQAAVGAAFRRVARPRGPISRRLLPPGERRMRPLVGRLATREVVPAAGPSLPGGMVSLDAVSESMRTGSPRGRPRPVPEIRFGDATPDALRIAARPPSPRAGPPSSGRRQPRPGPQPEAGGLAHERFKAAALAHQAHIMEAAAISAPSPKDPLPIESTRLRLLEQLDPSVTVRERLRLRISPGADEIWEREDPLEPLKAHPEFPQPMIEPLQALSQDLVLPGLERVPVNTVTLLESNPRFIEAYMVGLNHEMSRELLWREFPTDQRGTYFRHFWDVRSQVLPPESYGPDVPPLPVWQNDLGENMTGAGARALIVLLIRGELLRRYPNATIYAVKAVWTGTGRRLSQDTSYPALRYPLFRGTLEPDVTFVGFDLSLEQARGDSANPSVDPGYYFVLQQQPTEPRFGLDIVPTAEPRFGGAARNWNELSWGHLVEDEAAFRALVYASVSGPLPDTSGISPPDVRWGFNAAHMAYVTLQQPVRVAIHAESLLEGSSR